MPTTENDIKANSQVLETWLAGVSKRDGKPAVEIAKANRVP